MDQPPNLSTAVKVKKGKEMLLFTLTFSLRIVQYNTIQYNIYFAIYNIYR